MKLTAFILLIFALQLSAKTASQTVTLSGNNLKLEMVLTLVKQQTGFNTMYDDALLKKALPVTITATNRPLASFLNEVFKDQPFNYFIENTSIFITPRTDITSDKNKDDLFYFPIDVKGRILDEKGEPVAGATIRVKGSNKGTSTDGNGEFLLSGIEDNAILSISGVNIETFEWKIAGKKEFVISVKIAATKLQDVTVTTGYGMEKRTKELGYSVARVNSKELMRTSPSNILTGLTGKISGLVISNQGAGMDPDNNIMLRGVRSINPTANNQPLFILNGSPLSFGTDQNAAGLALEFINNLNPNDVQDVTVLKGANGAAIYGPEGVNGVIIINTKKGDNKRVSVNLRTSSTFQQIDWKQRKIQETFGTGDLADGQGNPIYNPSGGMLWGPAFNGEMVPLGRKDENGDIQMVPYTYTNDRQKFWDIARNTQNNLSISQADNNSDFYLGLMYTDQTGTLPQNKQTKTGVLLNTVRKYNKWSIRFNMGYNYTNSNKGPAALTTDFIPGHVPLLNYKDYMTNKWADRNHYWSDESANPYETLENNRTIAAENSMIGNLEFKVKPLSWLTITERPGITFSSSHAKGTNKPLDYSDFAKELGANGRWISYEDKKAKLSEKMLSMFTVNNDLMVSGIHQAGALSVKTTLGNTIRQSFIKDLRGGASRLTLPVYNLQFGQLNETYPSERSELSRFYSFFGTILLGYQEKIFVEMTGRNDWDSKLAVKARNKNFYSGINTSIILNELFTPLKNLKWLTNARVRASVTRTANMNIRPYQAERLLETQGWIGDQKVYGYMRSIPNAHIRPENVISQEYGGNFAFLNNAVEFDITYYKQRNNGLILNVVNSIYSGSPTIDNAGVYDNNGWEFDLNFKQLFKTSGGLMAAAGIRLAINDNKVVSLPPVYNDQMMAYVGNTEVIARTGSHAFEFRLRDWKRDDLGRIIVDKNTGIPTQDYQNPVIIGRTLPKYTASANFNLDWKGLTFSVLAEYRGGNDQYNEAGAQGMRMGRSLLTTYNNRVPFVVPNSVYDDGTGKYMENKDVKIASVSEYYMQASFVSSNFLINAGFATLRELALSYDIDPKLKAIKKITIGVYGRDLFNKYAKTNLYGDPQMVRGPGSERDKGLQWQQQNSQNNVGSASSDYDRIPGMVQYGFVVNLSF